MSAAGTTILADLATSSASAGMALVDRRSRAVAEYWRSFAAVREPGELMALNLGYCSQMLDDYSAAYAEGLKPVAGQAEAAQAADTTQAVQAA